MATPNLGLPTSPNGATDIAVAYNPAMMLLDAVTQMSVQALTPTPPTTVAPGDVGKVWLIADSATGAWVGKDGQVALCTAANVWAYFTPKDGWRCGSAGGVDYRYDAATNDWVVQAPLTNPMTTPGDLIVGGAAGATTRLAGGADGQVLKRVGGATVWAAEGGAASKTVQVMLSDMTTSLTTGTGKAMWIAPEAGTLDDVWLAVFGQSSSGVVRVDMNKNGTTVFTTRPSIDASESTSLTGTAAVFSGTPSFVKGDIFTFDIDDAGTSAEGLQVIVEYTP